MKCKNCDREVRPGQELCRQCRFEEGSAKQDKPDFKIPTWLIIGVIIVGVFLLINSNTSKEVISSNVELPPVQTEKPPQEVYIPSEVANPVTSRYDALRRISESQKVIEDWKGYATNANCAIKDLNVNEAAYFVTRIDVTANLIECYQMNNFDTIIKSYNDEKLVKSIKTCDKNLIGEYAKAARGFEYRGYGYLAETCEDCNKFYAVTLGCVNVNFVEDVAKDYAYNTKLNWGMGAVAKAFALIDVRNGKVYW